MNKLIKTVILISPLLLLTSCEKEVDADQANILANNIVYIQRQREDTNSFEIDNYHSNGLITSTKKMYCDKDAFYSRTYSRIGNDYIDEYYFVNDNNELVYATSSSIKKEYTILETDEEHFADHYEEMYSSIDVLKELFVTTNKTYLNKLINRYSIDNDIKNYLLSVDEQFAVFNDYNLRFFSKNVYSVTINAEQENEIDTLVKNEGSLNIIWNDSTLLHINADLKVFDQEGTTHIYDYLDYFAACKIIKPDLSDFVLVE